VIGLPVAVAGGLAGVDSLLSIVQMPKGVPVGTLASGEPGAANAALLAASIVGARHPEVRERLRAWRAARTADVLADTDLTTKRGWPRSFLPPPSASSVAASSAA
jgi:5-(carboxyamino)imidazole ribonucleotide mutase